MLVQQLRIADGYVGDDQMQKPTMLQSKSTWHVEFDDADVL